MVGADRFQNLRLLFCSGQSMVSHLNRVESSPVLEILFEIDLRLIVNEKLQGTNTLQVIRYPIIYCPT